MPTTFYSHGKLLISGEYAVLDGAQAWAMPTKFGQYLHVTENDSGRMVWTSLDEQGTNWFSGVFEAETFRIISSSDTKLAHTLRTMLVEAQKLNPGFVPATQGYTVESKLTFPRDWGLGSSSTLINNLAQWAQIDPFQLLWNAFSGSGYDIACASRDKSIIYQLENGRPVIQEVDSIPEFWHSLYFVHLNKKRNSRDAIDAYRQREIDRDGLIEKISRLTMEMTSCPDLEQFEKLIEKHETLLSRALGIPTLQQELFPDYPGSLKSLGAWGGDFILATRLDETPDYFEKKGYSTTVAFQEMIL